MLNPVNFLTSISKFTKSLKFLDRKCDVFRHLQGLTLDVIGKCAFAMDVKSQTDPNDKFLDKVRIFLHQLSIQKSIWMMLCCKKKMTNLVSTEYETCASSLLLSFLSRIQHFFVILPTNIQNWSSRTLALHKPGQSHRIKKSYAKGILNDKHK